MTNHLVFEGQKLVAVATSIPALDAAMRLLNSGAPETRPLLHVQLDLRQLS